MRFRYRSVALVAFFGVAILPAISSAQEKSSVVAAMRACSEAGATVEARMESLGDAGWVHLRNTPNARDLYAMEVIASYGGTAYAPAEGTLVEFAEKMRARQLREHHPAGERMTAGELNEALERKVSNFALMNEEPLASLQITIQADREGGFILTCKLAATGSLDGADARVLMYALPVTIANETVEETSYDATRYYFYATSESPQSEASIEFYDFEQADGFRSLFRQLGTDQVVTSLARISVKPVFSQSSQ